MLIDLDAIANAQRHSEPYDWGFVPRVFRDSTIASKLADSFPENNLNHFTRRGSTFQRYDAYGGYLIEEGHQEIYKPDTQPPLWKQLALELLSPDYTQAVERATGVSLAGSKQEAVYWRSIEGCVMDSHCDSPDTLVSQLLYFNESWDVNDGGCLRLLRSWRMRDYAYEFPPILNTSLLIERSDRAWHGYKPIRGTKVRKALQIAWRI